MKWLTAKLKHVARFEYGDSLPRDRRGDGQFQVYGSNGPYSWFSEANTESPAIIVGRKGSYGKVNWSDDPCFASDTTFFIDRTTCRHHLRWLYWLLHILGLDEGTDEAAVPGLNREIAYAKNVIVPPLARQRAIADYLDRETEQLDTLVAAKERLLELLAEKRQALIDYAVTGRLDPQALSCNSGAVTAGEGRACVAGSCEPEHDSQHMWPVKRLRFLTQDGISSRRRRILTDAKKVTFLPMENIGDQGEIDRSIIRDIDDVRGGYTQFFDGDVLVAKITPCFENGKGALVNGTLSGVGYGTTELHVLAPGDEIDGRFLYYVTVGRTFRGLGEAAMYGAAGQKRVPEEFIRNYPVPAPPYARQRAIADYLDRETAQIDELAAKTHDTIALLRERRAALVAAAVTGQIDMECAS